MTIPEDVWRAAYDKAVEAKTIVRDKPTVAIPSAMVLADEVWAAAIERCAQVAENQSGAIPGKLYDQVMLHSHEAQIARAIRSLTKET